MGGCLIPVSISKIDSFLASNDLVAGQWSEIFYFFHNVVRLFFRLFLPHALYCIFLRATHTVEKTGEDGPSGILPNLMTWGPPSEFTLSHFVFLPSCLLFRFSSYFERPRLRFD